MPYRLPFLTELKIRLRTQYYYFFKRKELEELLAKRQGKCLQCGTCCEVGFFGISCPAYDPKTKKCKVRGTKKMPPTCKLFPFDKKNRFLGLVPEIEKNCGYWWKEK